MSEQADELKAKWVGYFALLVEWDDLGEDERELRRAAPRRRVARIERERGVIIETDWSQPIPSSVLEEP